MALEALLTYSVLSPTLSVTPSTSFPSAGIMICPRYQFLTPFTSAFPSPRTNADHRQVAAFLAVYHSNLAPELDSLDFSSDRAVNQFRGFFGGARPGRGKVMERSFLGAEGVLGRFG